MQIKARKCFLALSPSRWVSRVFLTCDNMLAVEYRRGQHVKKVSPHGPGAYLGHGGVPHVCCLYPGTQGEFAEQLYNLAQVWTYSGEWIHAFLYKQFGYQLVAPPAECGGCSTLGTLTVEPANPSAGRDVTLTCKVTNTDGSPKFGDAPEGTVTFYVDGAIIGTQALPDKQSDTTNQESASITWKATCQPQPVHRVEAVYTPSVSDYAGTSCTATVEVNGCTQCSVQISPTSPAQGDPVTITCTVTNTAGTDAPQGTVTFYVDGESIGMETLPSEPSGQNWSQISITWAASCTPSANHIIEAAYTPSAPEFTATDCSSSVTVSNCGGVVLPCCPNVQLPRTIYATLSNPVGGCACLVGTYQLNWVPGAAPNGEDAWMSAVGMYCGVPNSQIGVFCGSGGFYLDFFIDGYGINSSGFLGTLSCTPLVLSSQCFFASPPCDGGVHATVTE